MHQVVKLYGADLVTILAVFKKYLATFIYSTAIMVLKPPPISMRVE